MPPAAGVLYDEAHRVILTHLNLHRREATRIPPDHGNRARSLLGLARGPALQLGNRRPQSRSISRAQLCPGAPVTPPPIPRGCCLETGGRLAADGSVIEPLTADDLAALCAQIAALTPQAVAINLLFSFLDNGFEQAIAAALPDDLFVSRSSQVLPEYREYERGMATVLNAWVGPLVEGYLRRLREGLAPASVSVMQSSGATVAAAQAGRLFL